LAAVIGVDSRRRGEMYSQETAMIEGGQGADEGVCRPIMEKLRLLVEGRQARACPPSLRRIPNGAGK